MRYPLRHFSQKLILEIPKNHFPIPTWEGVMAKRKAGENLPLGSEDCQDYQHYDAIINEELILQIANILKSMGDINIEVEREIVVEDRKQPLQRQLSLKEYFKSGLKALWETLDVVLRWLEHSSAKGMKGDSEEQKQESQDTQLYKKKEGILRGLYHITALGSYTSLIGVLELTCKFLDVPENPFQAERDHIKACLSEVEQQKQQLSKLVEEACNILKEMVTSEEEFDRKKAMVFDNIVKQAKDEIESSKDLLSTAEETIKKLTGYMNKLKWFSRGLRFGGWGLTCYALYHLAPSSSSVDNLADYLTPTSLNLLKKFCVNPKVNTVLIPAAWFAAGYMWMSLFPSRAYSFHDSMAALELQHLRLTKGIKKIERKLKTAVDIMDGLRKSKRSCPEASV